MDKSIKMGGRFGKNKPEEKMARMIDTLSGLRSMDIAESWYTLWVPEIIFLLFFIRKINKTISDIR
jgi:hypothetical protein